MGCGPLMLGSDLHEDAYLETCIGSLKGSGLVFHVLLLIPNAGNWIIATGQREY